MPLRDDILANCTPVPETGCWLWLGNMDKDGYGSVLAPNDAGKMDKRRTHRVSYAQNVGPIPPGKLVLHHCDVRLCCNPEHLYVGTDRDNHQDAVRRDRHAKHDRHGMSRLTAAQVAEIRAFPRWPKGPTQAELAKQYGVSFQHISLIRKGKRW